MSVTAIATGLDVAAVASWISAIDFADWPQQHPIDAQLRPAMVNDLAWHGFGQRTTALVATILQTLKPGVVAYNRMLSVVMPGHSIHAHVDAQLPDWITRVHVPLTTNEQAVTVMADEPHHMQVGTAYAVDTTREHAVRNDGDTPRIHFMFDVR